MLDLLIRVEHVVEDHTAAGHVHINRQRLRLRLGFQNLSLSGCARWLISSRKFSHKSIPTVIVKIDASHIGVVQSARTSALVVITSTGTVKVGGWCTTSAGAGEGRSLELVVLALESLQKIGSGFRGKLIISKSDADGTTCKIEAIHLLQSLTCLTSISKSMVRSDHVVLEGRWELLTGQNRSHGCDLNRLSGAARIQAHRMARIHSEDPAQ